MEKGPNTMEGQVCPMCAKKTLTLMEEEVEVPYFGKCFLFSMSCSNCKFHKADVESEEKKDPTKYTFDIDSEKDMKVRVVKSSSATVKIPHMISMEPGEGSNGFITNIEGLLNRFKGIIEGMRDNEEDPALKKKAKNMLKKLTKAMWGQEKLKIIIEDPSGNSAIVSDKAVKTKMK
jgi:zinc finger protein